MYMYMEAVSLTLVRALPLCSPSCPFALCTDCLTRCDVNRDEDRWVCPTCASHGYELCSVQWPEIEDKSAGVFGFPGSPLPLPCFCGFDYSSPSMDEEDLAWFFDGCSAVIGVSGEERGRSQTGCMEPYALQSSGR
jgi:hypothetical protein